MIRVEVGGFAMSSTEGNWDEQPVHNVQLTGNTATSIRDVQRREEKYASGQPKIIWSAGIGDDGRYLLRGEETWYYLDGGKLYEATHELGRKVGTETFYRADERKNGNDKLYLRMQDTEPTDRLTSCLRFGGVRPIAAEQHGLVS